MGLLSRLKQVIGKKLEERRQVREREEEIRRAIKAYGLPRDIENVLVRDYMAGRLTREDVLSAAKNYYDARRNAIVMGMKAVGFKRTLSGIKPLAEGPRTRSREVLHGLSVLGGAVASKIAPEPGPGNAPPIIANPWGSRRSGRRKGKRRRGRRKR